MARALVTLVTLVTIVGVAWPARQLVFQTSTGEKATMEKAKETVHCIVGAIRRAWRANVSKGRKKKGTKERFQPPYQP